MVIVRLRTKFKLLILFSCLQISSQQFITDCNDPFIVGHSATVPDMHTYCDHACRPNPGGPTNVCSAAGLCLCTPACYAGAVVPPPPVAIGNDFCPLGPGDPLQNPNDQATCQGMCAGACPGGFGGELCRENLPENPAMRYRICTCLCPAQPCPPVIPPVNPTAPVVIPPVIPDPPVDIVAPIVEAVIIQIPIYLTIFFKKIFVLCKKFYILWWITFKIYLLQVFLAFCLKEFLSSYYGVNIDIDIGDIYRVIRYAVRFL